MSAKQLTLWFCSFLDRLKVKLSSLESLSGKPIVILDNAPIHTSAYTLDWFFVNQECVERLPLPKYSPFLNPLEEVFAVWKQEYINRIRSSSHVKDAGELIIQ
jgi:transposase